MTAESDRMKALKARFDEAHSEGMASLKAGDLKGFSEAVDREKEVIAEQAIEVLKYPFPASAPLEKPGSGL